MRRSFTLLLVVLIGCGQGVPVTLHNNSTHDLTNIILSGSGFTDTLTSLSAGKSATRRVSVRGESGLAVSFMADGARVSTSPQGYFEAAGRYAVRVLVDSTLGVEVQAMLR